MKKKIFIVKEKKNRNDFIEKTFVGNCLFFIYF